MKPNHLFSKSLIGIAILGLSLSNCKKEEENLDTESASAKDNAYAESVYTDVNNMSDQAYEEGELSSYKTVSSENLLSHCATVTKDTLSSPKKMTISFDPAGTCQSHDGRYRKGDIIVTYTGNYRDSGTVITITFDNYYVDNNQVKGTKTITNNGRNASGNLYYTIVVNGEIVLANGTGTITWNSTRYREWVVGESTIGVFSDDVYLITGSATGTSATGNNFTASITKALRRELSCSHFVSGTITFSPSGKLTRIIDFGNGSCDNLATVTINNNVYSITLL